MTPFDALVFLAQAPAAPSAQPQGGGLSAFLLPMIVIGFIYIFLIQRPGARDRQKLANQLDEMKKGDSVTTIGGLCGKIESIDKEAKRVVLRIDPNSTMTVIRSAISSVEPKGGKGGKGAKGAKKDKDGAEA